MSEILNINVRSFSFKEGIPNDPSGNGGGFVFDCRGILNPGRIQEFKTQTGRDQAVIDYLETKTNIFQFLDAAFQMVDLTVEDFITRGFSNLEINFGCTGGQHRSVYSADAMAKHLHEKFPQLHIQIMHVVQERKNWLNKPY